MTAFKNQTGRLKSLSFFCACSTDRCTGIVAYRMGFDRTCRKAFVAACMYGLAQAAAVVAWAHRAARCKRPSVQ